MNAPLVATLIALVVGGYLAAVAAVALLQRRLIFRPDRGHPGPPPADLSGAGSVAVPTTNGITLESWFLPPRERTGPTCLYLHGNGGHLGYRVARMRQFARLGWGVLLLGYRGYGGNEGHPSEEGLMADARSGLAFLRAREASAIVVWGESLGSGLAVRLAGEESVGGLVLEAPYTSIADLARRHFPWVPTRLLRDRFDSLAGVGRVTCPIAVLAAGRDIVVPPEMTRRLFAASPEPKLFRLAPEAGHEGLGSPDAFDAVSGFLGPYLAHGMDDL